MTADGEVGDGRRDPDTERETEDTAAPVDVDTREGGGAPGECSTDGGSASGGDRPADRRAPAAHPIWLGVAALVYWIGQWLPIPGVDDAALAQTVRPGGSLPGLFGIAPGVVPVVAVPLPALVVVRSVLLASGRATRPLARGVAAGVFVALVAIQSYAIAVWLESVSIEHAFGTVVMAPGLGFRLLATLTMGAAGALLWWLADRVSATGRAHGVLFLALVAAVPAALGEAFSAGVELAGLRAGGLEVARVASLPLALAIVGAVVVLRPPPAWPVPLLGDLRLRSPWDALGVVTVAAIPGDGILATLGGLGGASSDALLVLDAAATPALAVAFAGWWIARAAEGRGDRRGAALVPSVGLAVLAAAVGSLGFVTAGGIERLANPGPLSGERSYELVLAPETRFADGDGEAMAARLESLGASAEVLEASPRRITLRIDLAAGLDEIRAALAPRELAMHLLVWPGPELEPPPRIDAVPEAYREGSRTRYEGPCDAARAWAETLEGDGCRYALEALGERRDPYADPYDAPAAPRCAVRCLVPRPQLTGDDVREASVAYDPMTQEPTVTVQLTDAGGTRFARVTRDNVGRPLAIVVDGEILSLPRIQSEIPGGRLQITLGGALDPAASELEARSLAVALSPEGRIETRWRIDEQRSVD